jgi:hypothetical protein
MREKTALYSHHNAPLNYLLLSHLKKYRGATHRLGRWARSLTTSCRQHTSAEVIYRCKKSVQSFLWRQQQTNKLSYGRQQYNLASEQESLNYKYVSFLVSNVLCGEKLTLEDNLGRADALILIIYIHAKKQGCSL